MLPCFSGITFTIRVSPLRPRKESAAAPGLYPAQPTARCSAVPEAPGGVCSAR